MLPMPTQEFIKYQFEYDQTTGILTWKVDKPHHKLKGKRAGSLQSKGHRYVKICDRLVLEHRIIWLWMTGNDPGKLDVDHINHQRDDNRWCNLRLASRGENLINSKRGGPNRGITPRYGKFQVRIEKNGVRQCSTHTTLEEARAHYAKIEQQLYGEFTCDRSKE